MTDGTDRIAALSPAKRALLLRRLAERQAGARDEIRRLPREGGVTRFAASPGQQRLWFLHELDQDSVAYVLPIVVRLEGELDVDALVESIGWLVDRHEALRTSFDTGEDGVVDQVVHAKGAPVGVDVRPVAREDVDDVVRRLVAKPFDLRLPPLLHATVLRVTDSAEHVLVLCVHHAVVDGWSLAVLVDELRVAYTAFAASARPALPEPSLHYADFAAWQQEQTDALDRQAAYWRDHLAGVTALDLPSDRQVSWARSAAGDAVPVALPADLVRRLSTLADDEGGTLFMVLTACLATVLGRWSGQDDVVIGTPVAGRPRVEVEDMVGLFVNTVPLRVRIDGGLPFRGLLAHVRDVCASAYANQDVPFDRVVAELGARPDQAPLVRVLLALRNVGLKPLALPGVRTEVVEVPSGGAQLDLGLEFAPQPDGGLTGWLEFAADLFDRAYADRLAGALRCVLEAVVRDADRPVRDLPVLDDESAWQVTSDFSGARRGGVVPATVPRWFESIVDIMTDSTAVVDDATGETVGYRELDRRANRLAHHLRERGIRPEDAVCVCLDRGTDLVVSLLATLKIGAVYVPLDPGYPPVRLAQMAEDAAPRLMLTTSAHSRVARAATDSALVLLDEVRDRIASSSADRLDYAPADHNAAYVLFTSGSTGRPKGVVGTHIGLANRLSDLVEQLGIEPDERVLQKTPICFDPSLTEVLAPLVAGARLVIAPPGRHGDPGYLVDVISRQGITSIDFVPSMLRLLVEQVGLGDATASLRRIYSGGEELSTALAEQVLAAAPGAELINLYGPTEAAVDVSSHRVRLPLADRVPIGRPLAGVELYVLDEDSRPQPVGVPGQLFVGGVQLARGYLGRPALTAERFVPHPFAKGRRLYATGDRVSWLPTGDLRFLGRYDTQVKIRGIRVEPGEVETALRAHPSVGDAVVIVHGSDDTARLVGYVTPIDGSPEADAADLRGFLHDALPAAMVPTAFVTLGEFPLTSAGKVDRKALPAPDVAQGEANREPPADELETVLAGLWAEILGVDEVGVLDDFYRLGGHSLMATRIVARTSDLFRLALSLRAFIEAATVREFAGVLRQAGTEAGADVDRIAGIVLAVSAMSADEVASGLSSTTTPGK